MNRRTQILLAVAALLLMLAGASGCVEGGYRDLNVNRDAETGALTNLHYREQGTDTKATSVDIRAPGGWSAKVNGLDSNQTTTALAQERYLTRVSDNIRDIFRDGVNAGLAAAGKPPLPEPVGLTAEQFAMLVEAVRAAATQPEK